MSVFLMSNPFATAISDMGIPTPVQLMALALAVIVANRLLSS